MEKNFSVVKNNFNELPNNIEAEQSVIGSILLTNEIFDEVNTIISSKNFYDPMHQKIFSAIENFKDFIDKASETIIFLKPIDFLIKLIIFFE